ncbi:hypothetical protein AMK59_5281, partial [Oryctes borbonicus]
MIKKKNWLKPGSVKLGHESKDFNISWSSSSSEVEHCDETSKHNKKSKFKSKIRDFNRACDLQQREVSPIRYDNADTMESPVMGRNINDLSPTFNEKSSDELNKSPVIGKNIKAKNWKKRKKNLVKSCEFRQYESIEVETENSDVFSISSYSSIGNPHSQDSFSISQLTTNTNFIGIKSKNEDCDVETEAISQSSNDIFSHDADPVNIDVISTQNKASDIQEVSISQYLSSQESQIAVKVSQSSIPHYLTKSDTSTTFTSLSTIATFSQSSIPHYLTKSDTSTTFTSLSTGTAFHCLKRPAKKRYKKDGLAKQLQKTLQSKRASVSIWKHEMYLNKDHCDEFLYLRVNKRFTEYRNIIFECYLVNDRTTSDVKCLVVLNNTFDESESYSQYLKIYEPYSVSNIIYLEESLR